METQQLTPNHQLLELIHQLLEAARMMGALQQRMPTAVAGPCDI